MNFEDLLLNEGIEQDLEKIFRTYDWTWEMADDHRYWKKGLEQEKQAVFLIKQIPESNRKNILTRLFRKIGFKDNKTIKEYTDDFLKKAKY